MVTDQYCILCIAVQQLALDRDEVKAKSTTSLSTVCIVWQNTSSELGSAKARVSVSRGVVSISTPLQVKTQLHEMKQKLSQSQHTVRLREDTIQDLQKKLAAEADKVWDTISN